MPALPEFSIIVPTYNRAADLSRCLNSLVIQKYKKFEVIVCDDGSTDNTKEIVNQFQELLDIKYIWEENWGGPARPRNNGIKAAKSDWVCFLDSDDTWFPEKLERVKEYTTDYDVIAHGLDLIRRGEKIKMAALPLKHPVYDNLLMTENAICNSSICMKKSVLLKVKGVSEDSAIIGVEDYDLLLSVARVTDRFIQLTARLGEYHVNDSNIHQNILQMYKGEMKVFAKHSENKLYKSAVKKRQLHYFPYLALFHKEEAGLIFSSVISFHPGFLIGILLLPIPLIYFRFMLYPFRETRAFRKYNYLFQ